MSFFYDLNKKLDAIRETPSKTHGQLNERDMGKHNNATTGFKALADKAGKEYGSKAAGERVAGAVKAKMAKAGKLEEEGMSRAAKGYEKYGKEGMEALAKAGRDGKALDPIRKKYDKYDNKEVDEGVMDTVKNVGKRVASGVNRLVGHGSDEDMIKDLQRKSGAPVTGKKPATAPKQKPMHPADEYDYFTGRDKVRGGEQQVKEKLSPAKQKSFAALAPPTDKITFADKIAGAKKEVDEMLGDVAAEAMRNALSPKQKKIDMNKNGKLDANDFAMLRKGSKSKSSGEMDEERSKGTAFDLSSPREVKPKVGSVERGHKHDIKHTATGRMVTRRTDDQGNSVGADDDSDTQAGPRGRGRPKGTKGAIGAKGPSGTSKLMTREGDNESSELKAAMALLKKSGYKVTKAEGEEQELDEKAVSKKQQKFMGMVHATQKGEKAPSKEVAKVAKTMKKSDAEDFASTKHKGLPEKAPKKKKEESVEESGTTSGSVATSTATGGKGGVFGKGIYDSMNFELEQMIAESMSVNMSDSTEGGKSLTITATDEDALKLGMMLKNAGLGGGDAHGGDMHSHAEEPCETCGMPDCGCGDVEQAVDENAPDWPTNTETSPDALQYAGGLNKPKTDINGDGQTTIPNQAVHTQDENMLHRLREMAGIKQSELEPWKETMKEQAEEELDESKECSTCHKAPCECDEDVEESFLESIKRMREIAGIQEAKKPDFLDMDKDGDKKEPMSKAVKDKEKKVDESIFALTNQWKAYRG